MIDMSEIFYKIWCIVLEMNIIADKNGSSLAYPLDIYYRIKD